MFLFVLNFIWEIRFAMKVVFALLIVARSSPDVSDPGDTDVS